MALEEPELHVPPPLQRRLVHRIQALSTQTFVSTHSPMVAAISDPRAVSVLRNEGGALSSVSLLAAPLPAATPNGVRKLFQLNRVDTIAAVMHDVVLIPEGRTDHDWLKLLVRAVDLRQGWTAADESRFGSYVGVVPTHDAAVEATAAALFHLHPRVTALVDGDGSGIGYAQALAALAARPAVILRWPDGWVVEDVVGWILDADPAAATAALAQSMAPPPATIAELVVQLKSEDRTTHGLKQDQIAYEAVADVIGSTEACCRRARELLNVMTDVLLGGDNARFTVTAGENPHIRVFRP
jgi:hypothetical protein